MLCAGLDKDALGGQLCLRHFAEIMQREVRTHLTRVFALVRFHGGNSAAGKIYWFVQINARISPFSILHFGVDLPGHFRLRWTAKFALSAMNTRSGNGIRTVGLLIADGTTYTPNELKCQLSVVLPFFDLLFYRQVSSFVLIIAQKYGISDGVPESSAISSKSVLFFYGDQLFRN